MPAALLVAHADVAVPPPLTAARIALDWHVEWVPGVLLALAVAAYGAGLWRLGRRGDRWPVGRTLAFAVGIGLVAVALCSGLEAYDDVLFSAHMAQHMILSMIAPVAFALSAPVTLALRTLPLPARRALLALLHSRVARVLTFPVLTTFLYVLTPFALYFSPFYEATLRSDLLHELLHAHFLIVGCLFFWPVLGLDPLPGRLPHPLRLVLIFVTLPFHAFLGVSLMSQTSVIAGDWYADLHRAWGASPLSDQHTGGALLWISGDAVALLLIVTLAVQWMRADERAARQVDRRLDRLEQRGAVPAAAGATALDDDDGELAAYNARLAMLARRDAARRG